MRKAPAPTKTQGAFRDQNPSEYFTTIAYFLGNESSTDYGAGVCICAGDEHRKQGGAAC